MDTLTRVRDTTPARGRAAKRNGISDVAKAAGVSVTTVSHAMSGQGQVSAETRAKVLRVAAELSYAPNRIASALRRQRSGIIGFVSDEIATTPFAGRLVLGAQSAAAQRGMLLMVVNSNRDVLVERDQIEALLAHQVDAVIYAKMYHQQIELPALLHQIPTVLVNAFDPAVAAPAVVPDEEAIAEAAVELLIRDGHRSIAHLTVAEDTPAMRGRLAGYRRAIQRAGIGIDERLIVRASVERGAAATGIARVAFASFLERGARPTAVFCFNDQLAMGVYQAAALFDLRIPRDLSVVGVDNLELIADNLAPGLTTVALPHYEMGRWAVDAATMMLERSDAMPGEPGPTRMASHIIERESVAQPVGAMHRAGGAPPI
ncbi:LacI family DNA-binding transcriptional regulator [Naasia lichenicola]|uniref:LacI family DNA-binding transcriptional regulator n=1 Tax=Naasia lichenicola TaxID=2565933 RepID=UPI001E5EAE8C|nr:LacI family DNA-binding transcriptional regulator [Naasia lichenicola]